MDKRLYITLPQELCHIFPNETMYIPSTTKFPSMALHCSIVGTTNDNINMKELAIFLCTSSTVWAPVKSLLATKVSSVSDVFEAPPASLGDA
jgi:hypothetical protein